jgi:hypothetical protein
MALTNKKGTCLFCTFKKEEVGEGAVWGLAPVFTNQ